MIYDPDIEDELLDILAPREDLEDESSLTCSVCGWGSELCECDTQDEEG